MFSFLLRILAILWGLWMLLRAFGIVLVKTGKTSPPGPDPAQPQKMVKDPCCGMYMDPRLALRVKGGDGDVFFCSEECRRKYLDGTS